MASVLNQGLCDFLGASPTPFHAVATMAATLEKAGFVPLAEASAWALQAGGRYYVTRNQSSLIAFTLASEGGVPAGWRMVGAHTDSPCLKVKPQPELLRQGYGQLGVEVYGGALLGPWFDRDLSLAGRVFYVDDAGQLQSSLIDLRRPVAVIPSLAIHLDREVNQKRSINAQSDLPPIVMQTAEGGALDFRSQLADWLRLERPGAGVASVLDFEICLYDTQPPALVGINEEFIASARLDNLLSCFVGLQALIASQAVADNLLVCTDHEEVGSASASGAAGPFLQSVLARIHDKRAAGGEENWQRQLQQSLLLSVDNAHGIHPNFADKHDSKHGPLLNAGPVLKFNANQRYATNSRGSAMLRQLCAEIDVPLQSFVVRSDMGCGSTIGPLIATELGIETVDLGVPTFAMHSIRELAGSRDAELLARVLTRFYSH